MEKKEVRVTCFRFNPSADKAPRQETYTVPIEGITSVLNALEYIQRHHAPDFAFYSCCRRGLCAKCAVKVNGVAGLACEIVVKGDIVVEPVNEKKVQRDIVAY